MYAPGELLSEEVFHPGQPNELGVSTCQAEGIGQPRRLAALPEASLKVSLAVKELADQSLARGHVRVVLYPRSTDEVKFALFDLLLDTLKEWWV